MFEDNNHTESDLLMRSILSEGQEEVPAHIWDGVASGLDKIDAQKKKAPVVLWWRRTAIATAAAAAIVAGVMLGPDRNDDFVDPARGEMIAVVEPAASETQQSAVEKMVAVVPEQAAKPLESMIPESAGDLEDMAGEEVPETAGTEPEAATETAAAEPEAMKAEPETAAAEPVVQEDEKKISWEEADILEEEKESRRERLRTSVVLSGIAGTNSAQNRVKAGPMKRPSLTKAPEKTGISETSTNTTYGIPLSFGVGVKTEFAPRWWVGAGISYTLLTRRFFGTYTLVGPGGSIESSTQSNIHNSQHYIGIPVNIFYDVIDRKDMNFYAYAGGAVERCIADKYALENTSVVHNEKARGVQLSANVGIGVEFMLGRHLGIYIDPSLRYYFHNGQPKSIRTVQPLMMGFEMGLRARL